ncbi:uncharacterized protein LOC134089355 [Sardina pilchardus]|uniref:uncharacterized protein LOC134089355 n=1 Tax=Sardina pilchardus TaxID=27697 RepID=UPI002E13D101
MEENKDVDDALDDRLNKINISTQSNAGPQTHRPPSPVPSCDSCSDESMPEPPEFSSGPVPSGLEPQTHRSPSPVPSCVSMKSEKSMPDPPVFSSGPVPSGLEPQTHRPPSPVPSCVSMKSEKSMPDPPVFSSGAVPSGLEPLQVNTSPIAEIVEIRPVRSDPKAGGMSVKFAIRFLTES